MYNQLQKATPKIDQKGKYGQAFGPLFCPWNLLFFQTLYFMLLIIILLFQK